ncbi:MAG: CBS domain-containing protein [Rhodothermaceae bacterium]|nr:CBS domain-containing protein [Rhodothermaceae bacterium]
MQPNPVLIPRVGESEKRVSEKHRKYLIHETCSIRDAFKQMDTNQGKFVLVKDDHDVIIGIVTDGDFRRAIFNGVSFKERVSTITNRDFIHFNHTTKVNEIKQVFLKNKNIQHKSL